jgi:hypothetical protein
MRVKLHSIPPANRKPGSLARTARFGKPARPAAQQTESTSFKPRVILPDPRGREAREQFYQAIRKRAADLERLIQEAPEPEEARFWQGFLQRLKGE